MEFEGEVGHLSRGSGIPASLGMLLSLLSLDPRLSKNTSEARQIPSGLVEKQAKNLSELWASVADIAQKNCLAYTLATSPVAPSLPTDMQEKLHSATLNASGQAVTVASEVKRLSLGFRAAGIPAIFYKGIALSLQTTGVLDARGGGDIDILVPEDQLLRAHEFLVSGGFQSAFMLTPAQTRAWRIFTQLHKESLYSTNIFDVDLHWRLFLGKQISPSFEQLLRRSVAVRIGEVEIRTLSPEDSLTLMCAAFYVDNCRSLKQLVDIRRLSLISQNQAPIGFSKQIGHLQTAVLNLVDSIFGDPVQTLHGSAKKWRRVVGHQWLASQSDLVTKSGSPIVPLGVHRHALGFEARSGNALPNLTRYLIGRVFEFRNADFSNPRGLLWRAFSSEVRFQLTHRLKSRGR
jgi:hypothetical protein